jgi:hypothetical protein
MIQDVQEGRDTGRYQAALRWASGAGLPGLLRAALWSGCPPLGSDVCEAASYKLPSSQAVARRTDSPMCCTPAPAGGTCWTPPTTRCTGRTSSEGQQHQQYQQQREQREQQQHWRWARRRADTLLGPVGSAAASRALPASTKLASVCSGEVKCRTVVELERRARCAPSSLVCRDWMRVWRLTGCCPPCQERMTELHAVANGWWCHRSPPHQGTRRRN